MAEVRLTVTPDPALRLKVDAGPSIRLGCGYAPGPPDYAGPYEITPAESAQTLATAGLGMIADVVVAPIPNNYGLVTWDGSVLLVS